MYSTRACRHVDAHRSAVYRALLDPEAIARWRVPAGMTCRVHEFDAREGGSFRVSLRYEEPNRPGKSGSHTDTDGGTEVLVVHDGIPDALPAADNETGTRMALAQLAELVEQGTRATGTRTVSW